MKSGNFLKYWPIWPIAFGVMLGILALASMGFSASQGFGERQLRLLVLGVLVALFGVIMLAVPTARVKTEALFQRVYTWFFNGSSKRAWLFAFLFTLVLFILFLLFFNKRYDYIDDPPIRDSIKQNVALLFSANVLRQGIHFLYQLLPDLPWYGISLYASMVCSLVIIVFIIIRHESPVWVRIVALGLFISLFIPFWMRASYNYASSIPAALAFICLFFASRKRPPRLLHAFLLGLLLAISFIFRRDGVKVGIVFIGPPVLTLLFLQLIIKKTTLKQWTAYMLALAVFLIPLFSIQAFDEYQYREVLSPAEQFHRTSNRSRSAYYGQPLLLSKILNNRELLAANGWNANDMVIAEYGMVLFDENKFAADRFLNIFNPEVGLTVEESQQGIKGAIQHLTHFGQLKNFQWYNPGWIKFNENWPYWAYYLAMVMLVLLSIWRGKHWYHKLFGPLLLAYYYLLSTYMDNYLRYPRHVAVPAIVMTCLVLFVCLEFDFKKTVRDWFHKTLAGIVLIGVFISIAGLAKLDWDTDKEIVIKREKFYTLYQDFEERLGKNAFIFVRAPLYLDYFVDPLGDQGPENQISFLNVSSTAYSPAFYQLLGKYGLERGYQVLPWMVDNPDAYFVSGQKFMLDRVRQFILETYSIQVEPEPVHVYPDGLTIYRLVKLDSNVPHFNIVTSLLDNLPSAEKQPDDPKRIYRTQITINGETRDAIFAHPDSEISFATHIPVAGILKFGMGFAPEAWLSEGKIGDGVQFSVYIQNDAERERVFTRYLDPKDNPDERGWQDVEVDLKRWSDMDVNLVLATGTGPKQEPTNDWSAWSEPVVGEWDYYNFCQKYYLSNSPGQSLDRLRVRRIKIDEEYHDGILQHSPGLLTYQVFIQPDTTLQFSTGIDPAIWLGGVGNGAEFEIFIIDENGLEQKVYSRFINPVQLPEDRRWFIEDIDLSAYANQNIEITFVVNAGSMDDTRFDWAYWVNPRLVTTAKEVHKPCCRFE